MKQILQKTFGLRAWMMIAMLMAVVSGAWADGAYYTLDTTGSSTRTSNSAYGSEGTATVGNIEWSFAGNGTMNPWRLGGKNISSVDRTVFTQTAMGAAISSVDLTVGAASNITVNSLTLVVASDDTFNDIIDEVEEDFAANSTITFEPTSGNSWATDSYYKFIFNVSVSGNSNKFVEFKTVEFYEATGGGGSTLTDNDLALTDNPVELEFDLYNNASAQVINYTTSSTGEVTIAESEYASFAIDEENKTITVTPTAVTTDVITITVNQAADESYKAGSTTFYLLIDDSTPIPTHTATFSVNGATSSQDFEEGAAIAFPDDPADVSGKTFVGWVAEAIEGTTNDAPEFVTSANMGESDITYYAVFAYESGSGSAEVVDVLNRDLTGVTNTSYAEWSGKTATSSAVYAGNSAGGNNAIQLRSNNSNSGIVTTTSGGKAKKVSVTWESRTDNARSIDIYGQNAAYSKATQLYNAGTQGVKIGSISKSTNEDLIINGDYEYIGIRSNSGALYLDEIKITWSTGGGVSYSDYCTTVVAATVARPTIEVEANPFLFSTTAAITCETEGAAIKYSFDEENWNDYTEALTITETTTIYAKAVKNQDESTVASLEITKNLATPTVTIDATGITNTNVFDGTEAGSLAASVTYNEEAVEGAVVTWSGNNDAVATIDQETGAVTLVAAGSVTFTANYAGNSDYAEKTETYVMNVTNSDPNAPGSENNPYTVEEAIAFIGTLGSATSATEVYVSGIISQIDSYNSKYGSITYWISDDGTTEGQMEVYSGLNIDGEQFSAIGDLQLNDIVTVKGYVKMYNSTTPEFDKNNQLVSLNRVEKPAAPTFSVAEDTYTEAQSVELSTTTEDAVIYYTLDGNDPTAESTEYTEAIEITETTTIKAIAVKDDVASDVATATYTIIKTPFITVAETSVNVEAAGAESSIEVTYNNMPEDEYVAEVVYCDAEGNEASYDWFTASINDETNNIDYLVSENTSTKPRTGYIKVYAIYDDEYFSDVISFTQAGVVVDYATLPFEWDDKVAPTGVTTTGTGTYNGSPYLKFASSGENIILKINERPGVLSFDIKGNNFSGGTFKVQTSADGVNYTDLDTYTELGNTTTQTYYNFDENIRYIKWVYTEKSSGNVALGNIKMSAYVAPYTRVVTEIGDFGTICTPEACDVEGAELFSIQSVGENCIYLMDGGTELEAGKAYFFKATETTVTFTPKSHAVAEPVASNGLIGSFEGTSIEAGNYILKNNLIYECGQGCSIGANRAYIDLDAIETIGVQGNVKMMVINGIATGIQKLDAAAQQGRMFNIAGQRVNKAQRGLYIVNGKKLMVK